LKKGEIWMANLSPTHGSEQAGFRPIVIVSGDLLNKYAPVLWVVPLTSKIKNYHGNLILEANEGIGVLEKSEVMNLHLRSIAKDRLIDKIGVLNLIHLEKIRKGLNEIMMMD
jgi:mRNA interferase MazF|tara:strand:- start:30048 stop:30383 length:336 start_codon:yes stop_codon:yes gene_type:complete